MYIYIYIYIYICIYIYKTSTFPHFSGGHKFNFLQGTILIFDIFCKLYIVCKFI